MRIEKHLNTWESPTCFYPKRGTSSQKRVSNPEASNKARLQATVLCITLPGSTWLVLTLPGLAWPGLACWLTSSQNRNSNTEGYGLTTRPLRDDYDPVGRRQIAAAATLNKIVGSDPFGSWKVQKCIVMLAEQARCSCSRPRDASFFLCQVSRRWR